MPTATTEIPIALDVVLRCDHGPMGDELEHDMAVAYGAAPHDEIETWHFWVVDREDWGRNHPLCVPDRDGQANVTAWARTQPQPVGVTTQRADVTCPDCLEWLHA